MVHYLAQAAMLEVDALIRQHAVGPTLQLAGNRNIRRVCTMIVDAGVSLGIYADAQVGLSRAGDKDAQVGGKQHIGILAHVVAGLDGAPVKRHHECAAGGVIDGAVFRQVNAAGRAQAQGAAPLQGNLHCLVSSGNLAAVAQQRLSMGNVDRAGDLNLGRRGTPDGLLRRQQQALQTQAEPSRTSISHSQGEKILDQALAICGEHALGVKLDPLDGKAAMAQAHDRPIAVAVLHPRADFKFLRQTLLATISE